MTAVSDLAEALSPDQAEFARRLGVVTDVDPATDTVSVTLGGTTADGVEPTPGVPYMGDQPLVGETVVVDMNGAAALVAGSESSGVPVGAMMMWATASPPAGWLICDGSAISSTAYPTLRDLLGATLPDMRTRVPVGAGTGFSLGATGGAKEVALVVAEVPSHNHSGPAHTHPGVAHDHSLTHRHTVTQKWSGAAAHSHQQNTGLAEAMKPSETAGQSAYATSVGDQTNTSSVTAASGAATAGNTGNAGSGNAHENMPPYRVIHYIVKAG